MSTWTTDRAKIAALSRSRSADDPELVAARQRLRTERLAEQIKRTVDAAPPLTGEQRAHLAALLRPTVGDADVA